MSILGTGGKAKRKVAGGRQKVRDNKPPPSGKKPWASKVERRLESLEQSIAADRPVNHYPPLVRRDIQKVRDAVMRSSRSTVAVRLGTVTFRQTHTSYSFVSPFTSSYATGGDAVDLPDVWGSWSSYHPVNKGGYVFEVSGSKLIAYDLSTGAEVTAGTNLTALNPIAILIATGDDDDRVLYSPTGTERVLRVEFEVARDVPVDAANHWTVSPRIQRSDGASGENFGTSVATNDHGLTASDRVTLYDDASGLTMTDGDRLVLRVDDSTGKPQPLVDLVVWLTIQREVR